jgi:surfactin family lipopeptide synthetase B
MSPRSSASSFVQSRAGLDQLRYWQERLSGELPALDLPFDQPRLARSGRVAAYGTTLTSDPRMLKSIEELASTAGTTVEVVTFAIFRLLLHVYTGQDDVIIGTSVATDDGVNRLAIRCPVTESEPFAALMSAAARTYHEARRHADYPFALLLEHLRRTQIFHCSFEYVDPGSTRTLNQGDPCEVTLRVVRLPAELRLEFQYDPELFVERTVARMASVYVHLARQIAAHPARSITELELVTESEREELIGRDSATRSASEVSPEATIDDLFADAVSRFGERRAVTFRGSSLTYTELDRRVDALARCLVRRGVTVGACVAIQLPPSLETMIAMLATLRAGASYLPIDADLPVDRVRYLLDDSGARFLIGGERIRDALAFTGQLVDLEGIGPGRESDARVSLPRVRAGDAAYIIYTSGTTGTPKGVVIEHHSLVNYVSWFRRRYGVDDSHRAALLTSFAFDLGYTTLWTTILSGGELHFLPKSTCEDVAAAARYVRDNRISFIKVTPSLLSALVSSKAFDREHYASLRLIVTGGERVRMGDIETIYARCPDVLVVNHYGPTETTIGVTTHPVERTKLAELARRPVIGTPIGNVKAYVATRSLQLLPIGAPGELLIAGRGVGRGYHRRDDLTREKFIRDPFAAAGNVYRTGDLVRWTPEGTLEFLGRIDRQVKVRGYRIEPSEIEQVMRRRLGMTEVVVVDKVVGESNHALCAYYVADVSFDAAEMRANLCQVLPEYMVPTYFNRLPSLPRTANGKLDVKMLPEPHVEPAARPTDRPRTETERILLKMWSDVLGVDADALGVSRNFFELGGHSLLMIQLIAAIDDRFGRTVQIPVFYQEGTIRAVARILDSSPGGS